MQAVYSDRYQIDLGLHVFPTAKYRLIAERLSQRPDITLVEPEPFVDGASIRSAYSTTLMESAHHGS